MKQWELAMKLLDENGREVIVAFNRSANPIREKSRSKFQKEIYVYLKEVFPNAVILEEWVIPNSRLSFDFFIPEVDLLIECQGEQHRKFVKFFHSTPQGFMDQKRRDKRKRDWAESNDLDLVCIYTLKELKEYL